MRITINGEEREVLDGSSVSSVLQQLQLPEPEGIAVAVNLDVVPRAERPKKLLVEGDRIDVVIAVGGG